MKKIINQKRYNTESARECGSNEYYGITETLYRKQTGEFFIHASGDCETLTPITDEQARDWINNYSDKTWRDIHRSANTITINIRISPELQQRLYDHCTIHHITRSDAIVSAIQSMLNNEYEAVI